jgi:hypothetical protein
LARSSVCVRHQNQEFVPALAKHNVAAAENCLQYFGKLDQECIALDHSKLGIDGAESVD